MRVLFDTNVVLDVPPARAPHARAAALLTGRVEQGGLDGLLCAPTLTTIHYVAARTLGAGEARTAIGDLLRIFEIAPVTRAVLLDAVGLPFGDFEDAVLHEAARRAGAEAIVTRNGADFREATLPDYAPPDLPAVPGTMG